MTACTEKSSSAEVLKKKKIEGDTIAVCRFPDETIRLAVKTEDGYTPFFTMNLSDINDIDVEKVQIQSGYTALEHDLFRVMYYIKSIDDYETTFFYFDTKGKPVCVALCKGQFYLVDLDGDNDNEIVTTWGSGIENTKNTLVYDWQDGKAVVSNVIENARRAYDISEDAVISVGVELPDSAGGGGYPDANVFPEYGAYMSFRFEYSIPSDNISRGPLHVKFTDIKDFKPFVLDN